MLWPVYHEAKAAADADPLANIPVYSPQIPYAERDVAVLYRACSHAYDNCTVRFNYDAYKILSYTACGAWIDLGYDEKKFVNLRGDKQWAYAHQREALYSLKRRKQRHVLILEAQWNAATRVLHALKDVTL